MKHCSRWLPAAALALALLHGADVRAQAAKPDLLMVVWTAPSGAQGRGSKVKISFQVRNYGGANAGPFAVGFYYGDSASASGLTALGSYSFSAGLKAASTAPYQSITVTLPGNVLYGNRYLHYHVDYTNKVAESDETNNRGNATFEIQGQPDLQVSKVAVSPTTLAPGGTMKVVFRLYNGGYSRVATTFYTRFYYSTSSVINTTDTYLNAQVSASSVIAGGYYPPSVDGVVTLALPTGASSGVGYIGVIADFDYRVLETLYTNNTGAAAITVTGGGGGKADLSMYSWSSAPSAIGYGGKVAVSMRVQNTGTVAAGPFVVKLYYADSASPVGATNITSYKFTGLGAKSVSSTRSFSVGLPRNVLYGARRLHYFVDAYSQIAETSKSNNRGTSPLSITGKPDLQLVTLAVAPTTQSPGGALSVSYRVRNAGPSRAGANFVTRFYYSADAVITHLDSSLGQVTSGQIGAGEYSPATASGKLSLKLPAAAKGGTRYVGGYTDQTNKVAESSEGNNTRAAAVVVKTGLGLGLACSTSAQCQSTHCVDGVCCNIACGLGVADCWACSVKAGGSKDGICVVLPKGRVCRAAAGSCDLAEACSGTSASCPADKLRPVNTTCRAAKDVECDLPELCSGGSAACPGDLHKPNNLVCSKGLCVNGLCLGSPPADSGADSAKPDARPVDLAVFEAAVARDSAPPDVAGGDTATLDATGDRGGDGPQWVAAREGCSCRLGAAGMSGPYAGLMLLLWLVRRRRRRR